MTLHIQLPSGETAILGSEFLPLNKADLKRYVRMYERVWVRV